MAGGASQAGGGQFRQTMANLRRVAPYARPYRGLLTLACVVVFLAAAVALLQPWPMALLIDSVLVNQPLPGYLERVLPDERSTLVLIAVIGGLVVSLLGSLFQVGSDYVLTRLDQRMVLDFRSDLFRHVQQLSMEYHDRRKTGEFMANINARSASLGAIVSAFPTMLQALLTLIGMFLIAYHLDPQLALLSLTVVPFLYYSTGYYGNRIGPQLRRVRGMEGRSISIVHEAVQMIRVIVAFGREAHEYERFRRQGEEAVHARVQLTVRQTLFSLGVNLITAIGTALVLGVGAYSVIRTRLTVGELLVVMSYVAAVYQPLEQISSTITSLQERIVSLEGAFEMLDTQPAVIDPPDGVDVDRAAGHLVFDGVCFSYEGRDHTLEDISFEVAPGQVVGVVGPTGAGKSTLLNLMPRFMDPADGRILLDGVDLRDYRLGPLRRQFSLVLQEPLLFSGTIEDNIRYGRLEASEDEVIAAAKAANAHHFVTRLPKGYRTKIGERGAQLSGGERQRISIARAFLKDAPVLLLDEPTSSVDARTEAGILAALGKLMQGRTTITVAHRLSTLRDADLLLVLHEGRIAERGTHEALLARGGVYREMHDTQMGQRLVHELVEATQSDGVAGGNGLASPRWLDELRRRYTEQRAR